MMDDADGFGITRMKSDNDLLDELIKKFNNIIGMVDIKPHINTMRLALSTVESIYMNFSSKISDENKPGIEAKIKILRQDFNDLLTKPSPDKNTWPYFFEIINRIKDTFRIIREELK